MRKNYSLYICIFCFIILNIILICSNIKNKNNQEEYFRLHIVANSNSIDDQIIKLSVVKKINKYINYLYTKMDISNIKTNNKEYSKKVITNNIDNILDIANTELKKQNVNYYCYANIGKISYDAKKSETINMNKGIYDSIQVILGEGKGENFWSLIFPYSYNPNYNISKDSHNVFEDEIKIKSSIIENLKKAVKTFKS